MISYFGAIYGDYLTPPPLDEQVGIHLKMLNLVIINPNHQKMPD